MPGSTGNIIVYDAHQYEVEAVTVYQSNQAEITRKVKVNLKDGQNTIEIQNLPTSLDQNSIRVDGIGNAVIVDVVYQLRSSEEVKEAEVKNKIVALTDQKSKLELEMTILDRKLQVINKYADTLNSHDSSATQFENFLGMFTAGQREVYETTLTLQKEYERVQRELSAAQAEEDKESQNIGLRGAQINVIALGNGNGEAELSLTYVVSGASWTPQYDMRATIATDQKSESKVKITYRASINQSTGEDWSNVALTLSTALPQQGTTVPILEPYRIAEESFQNIDMVRRHVVVNDSVPMQLVTRPSSRSRSPSMLEESIASDASPRVNRRFGQLAFSLMPQRGKPKELNIMSFGKSKEIEAAEAPGNDNQNLPPLDYLPVANIGGAEGVVSATFVVPGLSSIPNDTNDSSQTHTVFITEMQTDSVELEWVTVPKEVPKAFLQCKIKNNSTYIFLTGQTNVFMNNNFVAKSSIPNVSPQETFTCSLGADPAVRVTYHPQTKKTKTSTVNGIGYFTNNKTKSVTTTFEQTISIKNTRSTAIEKLIVKDQVPVSNDERLKVTVLKPKELAKKGKALRDGPSNVKPRWAQRIEDTEDAQGDDNGLGLVEWICNMDAGANVDVTLAWEIVAPVSLQWGRDFR